MPELGQLPNRNPGTAAVKLYISPPTGEPHTKTSAQRHAFNHGSQFTITKCPDFHTVLLPKLFFSWSVISAMGLHSRVTDKDLKSQPQLQHNW